MKTKPSESTSASQSVPLLSRLSTVFALQILLPTFLLGASVASAAEISSGLLTFTENSSDGGVTVTGLNRYATGNIHDLPIPSFVSVGGINKPVTGIGDGALRPVYLGKVITGTVTIPGSVVTIGEDAFYGNEISGVILPDSITYIGPSAFESCSRLVTVRLPARLTDVSYDSFYGCSSLTSVHFPEGLTAIGQNAFKSCTSLLGLALPQTLTRIYSRAFENCVSLKSVHLPGAVTQVGTYAFKECASLESVVIEKSVSVIGSGAFSDCDRLGIVAFHGLLPTIDWVYPDTFPFSSNSKITIQCYPGLGFAEFFDAADYFSIQYFSVPTPAIAVNVSQHYFGRSKVGKASPTYTFRIQNTGDLPLEGISVGIRGGDYRDFKIVSRPLQTVAPGDTTTFMVKFYPKSKGKRGTFLSIESNDPDDKITLVKITGGGI